MQIKVIQKPSYVLEDGRSFDTQGAAERAVRLDRLNDFFYHAVRSELTRDEAGNVARLIQDNPEDFAAALNGYIEVVDAEDA